MTHAPADEAALLDQARAGDQAAFSGLVTRYETGVRLHCYRMLGSYQDAEDVTQEVLVRAWRHLGSFDGRSSLRTWLYRIATNRCLTSRARKPPEAPAGAAFAPPPPNAPEAGVADLQPFPDAYLGGMAPQDPGAVYDLRESVSLAFLTMIQLLPARQRAVLLLRDVLGFTAAETAGLLDMTVAGANSALQRARAALEPHRAAGRVPGNPPPAGDLTERQLLGRYITAWHANDIPALLSLLREDALLTMPPFPAAYRGRHAIGQFLRSVPAGGRLDQITLVPTRANLQPAVAAYVRDGDGGGSSAYGIMVLTVDGDHIIEITGFADPALFPDFGLPARLEDEMAYDETLAARIREVIGGIDGEVAERKMFGGLAFMLNGHMFTGVVGDELMLRLGDAGAQAALRHEHVREMDFTGRPMKAMVFVEPAGLRGEALSQWVTSAAAFVQSLPPKSR